MHYTDKLYNEWFQEIQLRPEDFVYGKDAFTHYKFYTQVSAASLQVMLPYYSGTMIMRNHVNDNAV